MFGEVRSRKTDFLAHSFILQEVFHLCLSSWDETSLSVKDRSKTLRFNAGSRAGMCCNHLALILGCGVGEHSTAQESVVVKCFWVPGLDWCLCCWPRVRWDRSSLQVPSSSLGSPAAVPSQPPLPHLLFPLPAAPQAGRLEENFPRGLSKNCLFPPCLKIGALLSLFILYTVLVLVEQPFCKLHCSFGWEQGFCLAEILW